MDDEIVDICCEEIDCDDYNCEKVFNDLIAPLIRVLTQVCEENKVPFIFHAAISRDGIGGKNAHLYVNHKERFDTSIYEANRFLRCEQLTKQDIQYVEKKLKSFLNKLNPKTDCKENKTTQHTDL